MSGDRYTHGHHDSVLRSHRWRTAENSAAHLLEHLRPDHRLLDLGCGPGTITVDLAGRVAEVVGIDASAEVIAAAEASRSRAGTDNVTFATGDVYALDAADASFDVVHLHQVLQHLRDPVAALAEARRVLRPGGVLAARDSDYPAFAWSPELPELDEWLALYRRLCAINGTEPAAGRHLLGRARAAGFTEVTYSSSTWTFWEPADREWWADLWAERVVASSFADQARSEGLADDDALARISAGWRAWGNHPDATFVVVHGEVLARR